MFRDYSDYSGSQISLTKTRLLLAKPRQPDRSFNGLYQFGGGSKLRLVINLLRDQHFSNAGMIIENKLFLANGINLLTASENNLLKLHS